MRFSIRPAASDDQDGVEHLWRSAGLVVGYNDPVADFRFAVSGPASAVLIAESSDGELIGAVMVGHDGHRGWLYYVASAITGVGVGRAVVEAAERWLEARGVRKVQLMVRPANAPVAEFYERLGYEEAPRIVLAKWLSP